MHYIWNRVDRVSEDNMPEVVESSFKKWVKEKNELLNKAIERKDESEINRITKVIKRQELNYTENMRKYYFPQSCK